MTKLAFVCASVADKTLDTWLKELAPTSLQSKYDIKYLCSSPKDKILKKDVDLEMALLDSYSYVVPVGAEALKYVCGMTGITKYNGTVVKEKYIPLMHPNIISVKPQSRDEIVKALSTISEIVDGKFTVVINDKFHQYIDTDEVFNKWMDTSFNNAKEVVCDIETTGLSFMDNDIIGVAFSTKPHEGVFISKDIIVKYKSDLKEKLKNKKVIFHNGKFDQQFLTYHFDWEFPDFEDTMLLHYCLEEAVGTHGLKSLAMKYTDLGDYERELDEYKKAFCRKSKIKLEDFNYGMLPLDILSPYACKDADASFQLYTKFKPLVDKNPKFKTLYETILLPASKSLMTLERNGGPIDVDFAQTLVDGYKVEIDKTLKDIYQDEAVARFERIYEKTFNPNSTMQLRELFFTILRLQPVKKTDSGAWSTDKEVLEELDHPLANLILDLRKKKKIQDTYLEGIISGLSSDKRLRSGFNIHGTTSGRLSSSGVINYQNIPRDNKDIKKMFKARPGFKIVQGDLKTAEVYYAAVLSKDEFLQKAFIEKVDFHSYIAKQIFNLPCSVEEVKKLYPDNRQWAKAITFGIMYQAGPGKIAETANVTYQEAKVFINKYFREASNLKVWIDQANDFIAVNAYIYSFFGRKRRLPESKSPNRGVAGHAIRSGVNFLVQSVASDINLLGLVDAMKWVKDNNYQKEIIPFTVVHDSIVAEVREDLVELWATNMRKSIQVDRGISIPNCPIDVDFEVGPSWGELDSFKV
jgi:DNA polymerase I-like protein with 3'-5' exonuclease and polymerase domains